MNDEKLNEAAERSRAREDAHTDLKRGWYSTSALLERLERQHQAGNLSAAYRDSYKRSVRGRSNA